MNILALDCGSKTGWAALIGKRLESGVTTFTLKRGESRGMIYILFNAWLGKILHLTKPKLVVYEMAHHRGGAPTEILIGMVTRVQEECLTRNIDYTSVHSATVKKFATGKGNASKEEMFKKAAKVFSKKIEDDNEADALFILKWAKEEYLVKGDKKKP